MMGVSAKPVRSNSVADGAHAAVHHVAGRHDVRARLGVAGGGAREQFQRGIVQDFPRRLSTHAAMAVLHVFAQAHVGDDQQRRQFFFQQPHGLLDDAVLGIGAGGFRVFVVRNAEQQNRRNAERVGANGLAQQFIGRKLEHAGHGVDGAAEFFAGADEQRQHELRRRSNGFRPRAAATPATAAAGAGDKPEMSDGIRFMGAV